MALSVNTNISALVAQMGLSRSTRRLDVSLERLSTGLRINRAGDDPAGLTISQYQRAQITGLDQALTNINNAVSTVRTADAALNEIYTMLNDLRGLAAEWSSLDDDVSLEAKQAEVDNLVESIDRVVNTTRFRGRNLLDGSAGIFGSASDPNLTFLRAKDLSVLNYQPAAGVAARDNAMAELQVDIDPAATKATHTGDAAGPVSGDEDLWINNEQFELKDGTTVDQVLELINDRSGQTGVSASLSGGAIELTANEYGSAWTIDVIAAPGSDTGLTSTPSPVSGTDVEGEIHRVSGIGGGTDVSATGRGSVLTGEYGNDGSGISVDTAGMTVGTATLVLSNQSLQFQVGAFAGDRASLTIHKSNSESIGLGVGTLLKNLHSIDVRRQATAQEAIAVIDQAIADIGRQQGEVGGFQRGALQATQRNVESQLVNISAAESSLRDTDYASEITKFVNEQIRQQAATTVLGLANQHPDRLLSLLTP